MTDLSLNLGKHPSQQQVQRSFRRGLGSYDAQATVQARIAADLARMLLECGAPQQLGNVLEFGCGTGHLTRNLLDLFQIGDLTLNDLVEDAAFGLSEQVSPNVNQIGFASGAIEATPLPWGMDLVASASTIQWVEDVPSLMARLSDHLAPGGWLALSGFGRDHFRELVALGSSGAAPGYLNASECRAVLPPSLDLTTVRQHPITLRFETARDVLKHLRQTGVNGLSGQSWTRADLSRFEEEYERRFSQKGQPVLTYDPVWMIARKRD